MSLSINFRLRFLNVSELTSESVRLWNVELASQLKIHTPFRPKVQYEFL